jgi:hypothetical protein
LQSDSQLHSLFGRALIRYFLHVFHGFEYQQVVVIFDQALTKRKQGDFQGFIKSELKTLGKPFHVYFQRMMTDMNGQIADYVAWSKFVQLERSEQRPWANLGGTLAPSDFNIFRNGVLLNGRNATAPTSWKPAEPGGSCHRGGTFDLKIYRGCDIRDLPQCDSLAPTRSLKSSGV